MLGLTLGCNCLMLAPAGVISRGSIPPDNHMPCCMGHRIGAACEQAGQQHGRGLTLGCICLRQAPGKAAGAMSRGTSHSTPHTRRLSLKRYSKRPCTSTGPSKYSRLSLVLSCSHPVTAPFCRRHPLSKCFLLSVSFYHIVYL